MPSQVPSHMKRRNMDPLIERFERLLRSYVHPTPVSDIWREASSDNDYAEAWAELDEFLKGEKAAGTGSGTGRFESESTGGFQNSHRFRMPPDDLRADYSKLEVDFGAPFEEVRISYKRLIRKHHPDLHTADREQHSAATRKAQDLNISFQRIKAWELAKSGR